MQFFISKDHSYEFDTFFDNDFENYKNTLENKALFFGLDWVLNEKLVKKKEENKLIKEKIFINHATPCDLFDKDFLKIIDRQNYFEKIFTSCPYTSKFLNKQYGFSKYRSLPIPTFSENLFKKYEILNENKKFDVAFCGGIHSKEHIQILHSIRGFKNIVMSYQKRWGRNFLDWPFFLNYQNFVSNQKKWDILYNTKVLVGTNLLYLKKEELENFKKIPNIEKYDGYELTCREKILPQMKSRMIEAASTKTLLLLKKDEWNVIEEWFTPNEDFVYWTDYKDLKNKLSDIVNNYHNYTKILDSASKKVKEFYFEGFMKKI